MVIDYWNDTDCLAKLAKAVPYAFIALGFLVAMSGQFVRTRIDSRVAELNKSAEAQPKEHAPIDRCKARQLFEHGRDPARDTGQK